MSKRRRRNGGQGFTPYKKGKRRGRIQKTQPASKTGALPEGWSLEGGLLTDPNKLRQDPEIAAMSLQELFLRKGGQEVRSSQPPAKLSVRQSEIIERLIEKYGEDVERMARDIKWNPFQLTGCQLKKHIASFKYWGRREVNPDTAINVKKLKWYNDPLKPSERRFVDRT